MSKRAHTMRVLVEADPADCLTIASRTSSSTPSNAPTTTEIQIQDSGLGALQLDEDNQGMSWVAVGAVAKRVTSPLGPFTHPLASTI